MEEIDVTEPGVHTLLGILNPICAKGPDSIANQILKRCSAHVWPFLVILFQKSFQDAVLPRYWKMAPITRIHNERCRVNVDNYRPLTVTSVFCKT